MASTAAATAAATPGIATATTSSSVVTVNEKSAQTLKRHPRLLNYIKNHLQDKVIHLYYGPKMMTKRMWKVIPYELDIDGVALTKCLEALTLFTLQRGIVFVLYNGTTRHFNLSHLNICVISVL